MDMAIIVDSELFPKAFRVSPSCCLLLKFDSHLNLISSRITVLIYFEAHAIHLVSAEMTFLGYDCKRASSQFYFLNWVPHTEERDLFIVTYLPIIIDNSFFCDAVHRPLLPYVLICKLQLFQYRQAELVLV